MTVIDHLPSRIIHLPEGEFLFFSGTSYLGMGHQEAFKAALTEGVARYGTIFSASRNNNLQLKIYEQAEAHLAQWTGAEASLTVTSGMMAGQLAVNLFKNHTFLYAPGAHPAIWQSVVQNPAFQEVHFDNHAQFNRLIVETIMAQQPSNHPDIVIAANAIDPLFCETYQWDWIKKLPNNRPITLLIDDSHGIGIIGSAGGGIYATLRAMLPHANIRLVVIASLAKALGIPGGVILSDADTIRQVRALPLFVGASPIVPAYLWAFLQSAPTYQSARQQLLHNIAHFKNALTTEPVPIQSAGLFRTLPDFPVFFSLETDLYERLYSRRIFISKFAYPKPDDAPITRIVLSALHTKADVEELVKAMSF